MDPLAPQQRMIMALPLLRNHTEYLFLIKHDIIKKLKLAIG
jgi:hypothetical protein